MKFNLDFKRFFILIISLVALFIPTYIAIASYYANREQPYVIDTITELTLSDPDGRTSTVSSENDEAGIIDLFKSLNESGTVVSSLPDSLSGEKFLLVSFKSGELISSYKYYFSTNTSNCYYTDPSGKVFRISTQSAKSFLGTGYAIYLYSTAAAPVLTASGDNIITPATLNWYYLAASNTYQNLSTTETTSIVLSYDVSNDIGFTFNIKPDSCTLKVFNGTSSLYDGAYDRLTNLDLKRNSTLTFVIDADWYRTEGCDYYGEATYTFTANISAPAEFYLGEEEVQLGELVVLSGVNVTDTSKITFTSEPSINYTPVFFADGDYVHALLPISYDLADGAYKFTVTYGVTTKTLYLAVKESKYGFDNKSYSISSALINTNFSEADVADYNKLFGQICAGNESIKYFNGAFLDYEAAGVVHKDGLKITLGFGKMIVLTNANNRTYRHIGVDYSLGAGYEVPVMSSGKVAYVGSCDVLGRFVVVDHGYGLKTWYTNLNETSVSTGDIVSAGQSVGKTGDTGFIIPNRLSVAVTVNGVPVSPYPLTSEGIVIHNFN